MQLFASLDVVVVFFVSVVSFEGGNGGSKAKDDKKKITVGGLKRAELWRSGLI